MELNGRRFTLDQELKDAVHTWLAAQQKTFSEGIGKLVQHGRSVLKSKGTILKNVVNVNFLILLQ